MPAKEKIPAPLSMVLDPEVPLEQRRQLMRMLVMEMNAASDKILDTLIEAAVNGMGESAAAKKAKELAELIQSMKDGPLRMGTFLRMEHAHGSVRRAEVTLQDGAQVFTAVPDAQLAASLEAGHLVLLDGQGKAVVARAQGRPQAGEEARLERRIGDDRVEVTIHDHERSIFFTSAELRRKLDTGEVKPGDTLLVCPRMFFAMDSVPAADGLAHYIYLDRSPVPDVRIGRDIGAPSPFIHRLAEHVRVEMTRPDIRRRYRLRRSALMLLTGVAGSGKTLSIQAFARLMYEIMSEVTGVPVEKLPPRIFRLTSAKALSMYLGESDKRLERFFDEVFGLYHQPFRAPNGKEYYLPVLAIAEEIEAIGRARGTDHEGVYDRILTAALQRFDASRPEYRDDLVIFICTTNAPQLLDPAFARRAGGQTVSFGRLTRRREFADVLSKHLRDLPFAGAGSSNEAACRDAINGTTAWLFGPKGTDSGQIELVFAGQHLPERKYRRDLLTGALVDRAVQEAAAEACRSECAGEPDPGVTTEMLIAAIDRQIQSIVRQVNPQNVGNYVDLPEGERVTNVRRLPQTVVLPLALQRAS